MTDKSQLDLPLLQPKFIELLQFTAEWPQMLDGAITQTNNSCKPKLVCVILISSSKEICPIYIAEVPASRYLHAQHFENLTPTVSHCVSNSRATDL